MLTGPPIVKPPTPAPTPEPVQVCPALTATKNAQLVTIILGTLFALETAVAIGYLIWFCFFKPVPDDDDGYESEESDLQIDEYLALPEGGLDTDIDNIKVIARKMVEGAAISSQAPPSCAL